MKIQFKLLAGLILGAVAFTANAATLNLTSITNNDPTDLVPYPNTGTIAPANTFYAASTGDISAYFFNYNADFTSSLGLKVNGVFQGGFGLTNTASSFGQGYSFGNVNAGDTLEFVLRVVQNSTDWSSTVSANPDGINHTYATAYSGGQAVGGTEDGKTIIAGTYVAFEDLYISASDQDFNDHQFVFTNVAVPEPAGLGLLGLGLIALGFARRRTAK